MDQTLNYADILTRILRAEASVQFSTIPRLKMVASCDPESGQFLLILVGWDNRDHWHHSIAFHAQLIGGKVLIETDMTEGLKPLLAEAGIRPEDFVSEIELPKPETIKKAA